MLYFVLEKPPPNDKKAWITSSWSTLISRRRAAFNNHSIGSIYHPANTKGAPMKLIRCVQQPDRTRAEYAVQK